MIWFFQNLLRHKKKFIQTCFMTQPKIYLCRCSMHTWKYAICCWEDCPVNVNQDIVVGSAVRAPVSVLDFLSPCSLNYWEKGWVSKSPPIIVDPSFHSSISSSFCPVYFKALLLGAFVFRMVCPLDELTLVT